MKIVNLYNNLVFTDTPITMLHISK